MKKYLKLFSFLFIFSFMMEGTIAQTKSKIKTKSGKTKIKSDEPAYVERNYATTAAITELSDLSDSARSYTSVQNLLDNNVTLVYDDNTFRGNEPVRKGDFIVALNSSLDAIKKVVDEAAMPVESMDSNMMAINPNSSATMATDATATTDATMAADATVTTDATMITDASATPAENVEGLPENSIYNSAARGLMEKGVNAPFEEGKAFKPGALMPEKEVYDVLNSVFGYQSQGVNPYSTYMSRSKFAMVLNNAVSTKLQKEYAVLDQRKAEAEQMRQADKARMKDEMQRMEQAKRDSMNAAYQAEQAEIERKAIENESSKGKKKRKTKAKTDDSTMKLEEK